jgi:Ca2+-binding RTX toxin-like protein
MFSMAVSVAVAIGPAVATTIHGTDGNDRLRGTAQADQIFGHGGNDDIRPGAGDDVVYGGTGRDELWVDGRGRDRGFGGPGADAAGVATGDSVRLGPGADEGWVWARRGGTIRGGRGPDWLSAMVPGRLYGGPGNDAVCGPDFGWRGQPVYRYWLGSGDDRAFVDGPCYMEDGEWDMGRDRLFAGPGDDTVHMWADDAPDVVHTGPGRDEVSIWRGGGRDRLYTGRDSDRVVLRNRSQELVNCGPGNDTLILVNSGATSTTRGCEWVVAPVP